MMATVDGNGGTHDGFDEPLEHAGGHDDGSSDGRRGLADGDGPVGAEVANPGEPGHSRGGEGRGGDQPGRVQGPHQAPPLPLVIALHPDLVVAMESGSAQVAAFHLHVTSGEVREWAANMSASFATAAKAMRALVEAALRFQMVVLDGSATQAQRRRVGLACKRAAATYRPLPGGLVTWEPRRRRRRSSRH